MVIDAIDISNIEAAIQAGGKIWENDLLADFKQKIKAYYRGILGEQCCYCRKNSLGEFKFVLDIEHILPKSVFSHLMFTMYNLSVSCKRCNMSIKNQDVSFLSDVTAVTANPKDTSLYKFIHPNFDDYFSHLNFYTKIENQQKIIKYTIVADSAKGQFTYDYFKLEELETDSINMAQGVKEAEDISEIIKPEIAKRIEDLLKNK